MNHSDKFTWDKVPGSGDLDERWKELYDTGHSLNEIQLIIEQEFEFIFETTNNHTKVVAIKRKEKDYEKK